MRSQATLPDWTRLVGWVLQHFVRNELQTRNDTYSAFNSTISPSPRLRHAVPTGPPISASRSSPADLCPVRGALLRRSRCDSRRQAPRRRLWRRRHLCHCSGTIHPSTLAVAAQLCHGVFSIFPANWSTVVGFGRATLVGLTHELFIFSTRLPLRPRPSTRQRGP